jgi:hypothetical protein
MENKTKESSSNFILIDPPSGWKYGFPKAVTQEEYKSITNLKQWCIDNGYPKDEADSYGKYFHIQMSGDLSFMNREKSTRELALEWWNDLPEFNYKSSNKTFLYSKYKKKLNLTSLTDSEIEQIYHNEVIEPKLQENWQESQVNQKFPKPNQKQLPEELKGVVPRITTIDEKIEQVKKWNNAKQFKEFNPELFKTYIDKFSDEDKIKAFKILNEEFAYYSHKQMEIVQKSHDEQIKILQNKILELSK